MSTQNQDATSRGGSSRLLRHLNDRAALEFLFQRQQLTRPELVELTGLSKPTASEVIKRLQEAKLVTVIGRTSGGRGPRADVYGLNPDSFYGAAVSVTEPDGLAVALVDPCGVVRHQQQSTVAFEYSDTAELVESHITEAFQSASLSRDQLARIHVAVPGSYDSATDSIHNIDVLGQWKTGWAAHLSAHANAEATVHNDVNLATVAERQHGTGRDDGFALLWIGERGLGLGIDTGDNVLSGVSGAAGEIGYLPTGSGTTLQDVAGGPAMKSLAADYGFDADTASSAVGQAVDEDMFVQEMAERLYYAVAAAATVLNPSKVVLSGEVGRAGGDPLSRALTQRIASTPFSCPVVPSSIEGDPVLRGAIDAVTDSLREAIIARSDHCGRSCCLMDSANGP